MNAAAAEGRAPVQDYLDAKRFEAIQKLSIRAGSYSRSAGESALRRDGRDCWVLLGQAALTLCEAIRFAEAIGRDVEADL
jgi:hypothetical protein